MRYFMFFMVAIKTNAHILGGSKSTQGIRFKSGEQTTRFLWRNP